MLLRDAVNATASLGDMADLHLHDLPLRIQTPVGFDRQGITVVAVTWNDDRTVGEVGIDVGTAAGIPQIRMIVPFFDELIPPAISTVAVY